MTDEQRLERNGCCAHLKVLWATEEVDGLTRGWWECSDCHSKFIPERAALALARLPRRNAGARSLSTASLSFSTAFRAWSCSSSISSIRRRKIVRSGGTGPCMASRWEMRSSNCSVERLPDSSSGALDGSVGSPSGLGGGPEGCGRPLLDLFTRKVYTTRPMIQIADSENLLACPKPLRVRLSGCRSNGH